MKIKKIEDVMHRVEPWVESDDCVNSITITDARGDYVCELIAQSSDDDVITDDMRAIAKMIKAAPAMARAIAGLIGHACGYDVNCPKCKAGVAALKKAHLL